MESGKIGEEGSDDSTLRGPERAKEDAQGLGGVGPAYHAFGTGLNEIPDPWILPIGTDWSDATGAPYILGNFELVEGGAIGFLSAFIKGDIEGNDQIDIAINTPIMDMAASIYSEVPWAQESRSPVTWVNTVAPNTWGPISVFLRTYGATAEEISLRVHAGVVLI